MNLKSRAYYEAQRRRAYERDKGRCVRCLRPIDAGSTHHRQGRGGPDPHRLSNLLTLCGSGTTGCHGWVHAHPERSYEAGWMVRRNSIATTDTTPVCYGDLTVLLEDTWEPR